ncbi:hypothetical protein [Helicobacter colisuis]|uniref:hypothetical protein n=1 Tax=Helicobacter colisuis TaxID=2949739 RepID=UPI00202A34B3|nr:hypothetical protein [Helicobacter colisuis]MCL9823389.1 hypothetical protein [Helicobacter colisuis]
MRKVSARQAKMLSNPNAKIVICNTIETKAMVDLAIELDKIAVEMKQGIGNRYSLDSGVKILKAIRKVLTHNSNFLEDLSSKMDLTYDEPASINTIKDTLND